MANNLENQAFDMTLHLRMPAKLIKKIDKQAIEVGLSRADFVRLIMTLAANDRELTIEFKERAANGNR